jgi:hypothetical protein
VAAIREHTQAMPMPEAPDFAGVIEAIRAMPAPVVNFQAGDVNVAPAQVTVEPAQVTIADGAVRVDAPITVQPAQLIQPKASAVQFTEDAAGNITGATLN